MSGRRKVPCGCQCGREDYFNRLETLEIEQALDEAGRRTRVKRFYVLPEHKEAFEAELGLMQLLQITIRRWARKPWYLRIAVTRRVMRLQHGIFERNKGFDFARRHAIRSAVLFAAPAPIAAFLHKRFAKELNDAHGALPTSTEQQAQAQAQA